MRCSDGATGTIQFQHVSVGLGYGTGSSSDGPMSLTYGLSANEAAPYLQLLTGKTLRADGKDLELVEIDQPVPAMLSATRQIAPAPEAAPGASPSPATVTLTANLKQYKKLRTNGPEKIAELAQS